jgi:purine-nucleoside phosphorylase
MNESTMDMHQETASFLKGKVPEELLHPKVAIICGSGLGGLAGTVHHTPKVELDYASIPHFAQSDGKQVRSLERGFSALMNW